MLSLLIICLLNGSTQQYPFNKGTNVNYKPRVVYNYIGDERGGNYKSGGLWSNERTKFLNNQTTLATQPTSYRTVCELLGGLAHSDPTHYIIDLCTLSDPFLARLPPIQNGFFTTGHLIRMMPTDYSERLLGNIDSLPDERLNDMLDDFLLVTRSNLFSLDRIKAIWRLNTGYYDHLNLDDFQKTDPWKPRTTKIEKVTLSNWSSPIPPDKLPRRFQTDIRRFNGNLLVESKEPKEASGIWLYLDHSFNYDIYVNEELAFNDINHEQRSCKGVILRLPQTVNIRSIKLIATGLKDLHNSDSNLIRFIRLLPQEDDIIVAETRECHYEHFVAAY